MKQHLSGLIKENMEGIHNEEDLIKKIKSNLSHLHKKDANHNAKTFIKQSRSYPKCFQIHTACLTYLYCKSYKPYL